MGICTDFENLFANFIDLKHFVDFNNLVKN
nr:MAG TPA: hypothetical protein [Caudoviricetes sp.]